MRFKFTLAAALAFLAGSASGQTQFTLTGDAVPTPGTPGLIDVYYTGVRPVNNSPYLKKENWKVRWSDAADSPAISVRVDEVGLSQSADAILLRVGGTLPGNQQVVYWTVLFNPDDSVPLVPQIASFTPKAKNQDCKSDIASQQPYFCPPGDGVTPDFSLTGSFLAAGGTKPIIVAQLKTDMIFSAKRELWGFYPGIKADVEINQSVQPPNNRTRFDPDSIIAGLTFTRIESVHNPLLYGIEIQFQLPEGEFSRQDPSSNIIAGGLTQFALKPLVKDSFYATLYPVLGLETGRNLNRPSEVDKTAVDLSRYKGILRGVMGADASIGLAAEDRKTDIFTITGSYRVRVPAIDEPFVKTIHQVTTVDLTTKARHWVEVDITSSPWNWKYFALNAKYQYGELPPLFSFVDHKFSIGFTLQAVQTRKPKLPKGPN